MPLPVIVPIAAVGLLLAAAFRKKKPTPTPEELAEMKDETEVGRVYRQAMDPAMKDLEWMRQAVAFLRSQGATDLAGNVSSRIASLQAQARAEQAAKEEAERARRDWEAKAGGPPTQQQLDAVWAQFQRGEVTTIPLLQFAWSMFEVYGTPDRAAAVQAAIDRVRQGLPPLEEEPPEPDVVVVDEEEEVIVPVKAPPTPPTEKPPTPPEEEPRRTIMPVEPPLDRPPPEPAEPPAPPGVEVPGEEEEMPAEEEKPDADPNGTIKLARQMISAESLPDWRTKLKPEITAWQRRVKLTADGMFGPGSCYRMAEEVGVLPRVRYWPRGWWPTTGLPKFRAEINRIADRLDAQGQKEHAAALRVSAEAEKAQGFPTQRKPKPAPIPEEERAEEAADVAAAIAAAVSRREEEIFQDFPWLRQFAPT